jgi:prepilin-type N-terminal cleavage/methylation domain-containing protein
LEGKKAKRKLHMGENDFDNTRYENGGYSLVELIIVVAIIAVVATLLILSVSMIFSANAKTCANALQSAIADCKVTTMGKADAYLEIYRDSDDNIYAKMWVKESGATDYTEQEPEKIGGKRVTVTCFPEGAGASGTELTAGGASVTIRFDRASGSFADADYANCAGFEIQGGSKHYKLTLTKLTGKAALELVTD